MLPRLIVLLASLCSMILLQVYQAKALKKLHEGSSEAGLMQELCMTTDLALQVTKVTVQAVSQMMSSLVVQECYLLLNLAKIGFLAFNTVRFLDAPISQALAKLSKTLPSSSKADRVNQSHPAPDWSAAATRPLRAVLPVCSVHHCFPHSHAPLLSPQ